MAKLGYIHAPVTAQNPGDASKELEATFHIDRGFRITHLRAMLETIGIAPERKREYVLADGSEVKFDIIVARMEIVGELAGSTAVFGESGTEPSLGALDLQAADVVVDPRKEGYTTKDVIVDAAIESRI